MINNLIMSPSIFGRVMMSFRNVKLKYKCAIVPTCIFSFGNKEFISLLTSNKYTLFLIHPYTNTCEMVCNYQYEIMNAKIDIRSILHSAFEGHTLSQ